MNSHRSHNVGDKVGMSFTKRDKVFSCIRVCTPGGQLIKAKNACHAGILLAGHLGGPQHPNINHKCSLKKPCIYVEIANAKRPRTGRKVMSIRNSSQLSVMHKGKIRNRPDGEYPD